MAKERKLPYRDSSARLQSKKDEMLGCDDALSYENRRKGRRLPGDAWYPGSALHKQIESVPTISYDICENMVGYRDQDAVNPNHEEIEGKRCYASLSELPEKPDVV